MQDMQVRGSCAHMWWIDCWLCSTTGAAGACPGRLTCLLLVFDIAGLVFDLEGAQPEVIRAIWYSGIILFHTPR